jgi:hypothetical protein
MRQHIETQFVALGKVDLHLESWIVYRHAYYWNDSFGAHEQ